MKEYDLEKDKDIDWMKKKKEKDYLKNRNGRFLYLGFALLVFFITSVTVGCLIYFNIQIRRDVNITKELQDEQFSRHYAMITTDRSSLFWQAVYQSAKEEAEKRDACLELMGEDLSVDYSAEQRMEIAIDSQVDGIIVEGSGGYWINKRIDQAVEKGIPVVTVLNDAKDSERQSFVGVGTFNMGKEYGQRIVNIMGNNPKKRYQIIILMESTDNFDQDLLYSGMKEVVEKQRKNNVSINIERINHESVFTAEEMIRDIFLRKRTPDILVCLNENDTSCAYQAVVDYNKVGVTNIIGYYNTDTILHAIERNVVDSTVSINTGQMGKECINALEEYIETGYVSEYLAADTIVIDKANVKDYLEENKDVD